MKSGEIELINSLAQPRDVAGAQNKLFSGNFFVVFEALKVPPKPFPRGAGVLWKNFVCAYETYA